MKHIWKFPIVGVALLDNLEIQMPSGSEVISVGLDSTEASCIWAEVDETMPDETRHFVVYGTGHSMNRGGNRF